MKRLTLCTVVALLLLVGAGTSSFAGVGLHAGLSIDPDDFLVGLHWKSHPIEERLSLVPSVEAGFGDVTMVAGNLDLHYDFKTDSKWSPYVGGGLTLNWFDFNGGSNTEIGGSILGGVSITPKMFFEGKLGLGDVPDFKLYVGWHAP